MTESAVPDAADAAEAAEAAVRGTAGSSRDAILHAAARLMSGNGFAATSISKISAACGLPASSIYWHFGSKDGIYVAVIQRARRCLLSSLRGTDVAGATVAERLSAFLEAAHATFERHPGDLRLLLGLGMLEESASVAAMAELQRYREAVREWAAQSLRRVFALDDGAAIAEELARFVLSVADGTAMSRWFEDPGSPLPVPALHVALLALARHHGVPVDDDA